MRGMRVTVGRWLYRGAAVVIGVYRFFRRPTVRGVRCLIQRDDQLLMVRHTYGSDAWTFPGGRTRRGEAPEEVAQREIAEELSLAVSDWTYLGQVRVGGSRDATQIVDCYWCRDDRRPTANEIEIAEVAWFPVDSLPEDTIDGTEAMVQLLRDRQASIARR
jgi:8-oxo-dGTP pyrophosphatase MutT (NUDIX family)